jgi:hypothetical protein
VDEHAYSPSNGGILNGYRHWGKYGYGNYQLYKRLRRIGKHNSDYKPNTRSDHGDSKYMLSGYDGAQQRHRRWHMEQQ